MKKQSWRKYLFEFLSIFVAVISAFALNNWNDNRKENEAESKILIEISNGLEKDLEDVYINLNGHKQGIQACIFWRNIINGKQSDIDSVAQQYLRLTRDFTSIQNTSGYETLKSRGFEIMDNDSLRQKIISLYEFEYQTLQKIEEEYFELQFQENYFESLNNTIAPNLIFDEKGNILSVNIPFKISEREKKILLSHLWKIQVNRNFALGFYDKVEEKINDLQKDIKKELQ